MNRDRWTSFPAATDEERALLRSMNGFAAHRAVAVTGGPGHERLLPATLRIEVAEPCDGKADVVVHLAFGEGGPRDGERVAGDPWALLDGFLREAEAAGLPRAAGEG